MTQKVSITIDGKTTELPVLEASAGNNVIDVRGLDQRRHVYLRPGLFEHREL